MVFKATKQVQELLLLKRTRGLMLEVMLEMMLEMMLETMLETTLQVLQ